MNRPRVLVTGGTGVLGRRVVERLGSEGIRARVLSRSGKPGTMKGDLAAEAGVSHLAYISIVGIDRAASYPYYRIKLETEWVVECSPVPYAILRATQFYDLVLKAMRFLDRSPLMLVPRGFLGQPIDAGEVAECLVDLALTLGPQDASPTSADPR